jgi:DNA repair/transcription protein MET18/MMS19
MADFKQLALDFVLSDDPVKQEELAKAAAQAIQSDRQGSNPVGQWILSISTWINESSDQDIDLIARGKGGKSRGR